MSGPVPPRKNLATDFYLQKQPSDSVTDSIESRQVRSNVSDAEQKPQYKETQTAHLSLKNFINPRIHDNSPWWWWSRLIPELYKLYLLLIGVPNKMFACHAPQHFWPIIACPVDILTFHTGRKIAGLPFHVAHHRNKQLLLAFISKALICLPCTLFGRTEPSMI